MKVRVRFAPSPTGMLHIGGARTALFNWLYARHTGGTFVLRVEDTDAARNTAEARQVIFDGLRWLGMDWDEGPEKGGEHGPYFQSERLGLYKSYVEKLLSKGLAYEFEGAVKFKMPKDRCVVKDLICGNVEFDRTLEPDLVILRKDGSPVFHLVNVVDDLEMKITHVIRGEDHLSNTQKHLALFAAFAAEPPQYAHIPLILNNDGSKMSKRDAGSSIAEYHAQGYVAEALRNYLCLLGWSPKDDREIVGIDEVIKIFDLPQVNRHNARFDMAKLHWMNGQYMAKLAIAEFTRQALPFLKAAGQIDDSSDRARIEKTLSIVQEKVKLFQDLPNWTVYLLKDDYPVDAEAVAKTIKKDGAVARLAKLRERYSGLSEWTAEKLEAELKALAGEMSLKTGEFIHPCRVAVSGKTVGPSLYHMLEVLGRQRVLDRLDRASKL